MINHGSNFVSSISFQIPPKYKKKDHVVEQSKAKDIIVKQALVLKLVYSMYGTTILKGKGCRQAFVT